MADVVRLVFGEPGATQVRHKIAYRHRDLRDAVEASGKDILELLNDRFSGWCYLVQYGRRQFDPKITKDGASDLIDAWLKDNEANEMDTIGKLLIQAVENSKYIKFPKAEDTGGDEEPVPEGNAQTQTTTRPTTTDV
jgi:hypothetical protein